jgi:fructose-specific phosphotransferase system IIC component
VPLWLVALVIAGAVAGAVAIKLLVRRRAPEGGWFTDSSRGAGTFGVLGTMFSVVLAA